MSSSRLTESGAQPGPLALLLLIFFIADNEDQDSEMHEKELANQDRSIVLFSSIFSESILYPANWQMLSLW